MTPNRQQELDNIFLELQTEERLCSFNLTVKERMLVDEILKEKDCLNDNISKLLELTKNFITTSLRKGIILKEDSCNLIQLMNRLEDALIRKETISRKDLFKLLKLRKKFKDAAFNKGIIPRETISIELQSRRETVLKLISCAEKGACDWADSLSEIRNLERILSETMYRCEGLEGNEDYYAEMADPKHVERMRLYFQEEARLYQKLLQDLIKKSDLFERKMRKDLDLLREELATYQVRHALFEKYGEPPLRLNVKKTKNSKKSFVKRS